MVMTSEPPPSVHVSIMPQTRKPSPVLTNRIAPSHAHFSRTNQHQLHDPWLFWTYQSLTSQSGIPSQPSPL